MLADVESSLDIIALGEAAIAAVDTCATAFLTDQRELPADHADERLWGPLAGQSFDDRYDRMDWPEPFAGGER